jgi:hypothetical protein
MIVFKILLKYSVIIVIIQTNCKVITLSNGTAATTNVETFTFYNVPVGIYIKACLFDPIFLLVSRDIEHIYIE